MPNPETISYLLYNGGMAVSCIEGLTLEGTIFTGVANIKVSITFGYSYLVTPGVFGTVGSSTSLTDSTGLRVFDRSTTGAAIIVQEDQCGDEETDHTTGETVFTLTIGVQTGLPSCTICFAKFTTAKPSTTPSFVPTFSPSSHPSSSDPTPFPSSDPTPFPSSEPTPFPSSDPTPFPSSDPTLSPSSSPTSIPSSFSPTLGPIFMRHLQCKASDLETFNFCSFVLCPNQEMVLTTQELLPAEGSLDDDDSSSSVVVKLLDSKENVLRRYGNGSEFSYAYDVSTRFCDVMTIVQKCSLPQQSCPLQLDVSIFHSRDFPTLPKYSFSLVFNDTALMGAQATAYYFDWSTSETLSPFLISLSLSLFPSHCSSLRLLSSSVHR
jgi:hypothetical protein